MKRVLSSAVAIAVLLVPSMLIIGLSTNARAQTKYPKEIYLPPATSQSRMTVNDVIKLSKAGLSDDLIIQQIRSKGQRFDLSTDQLLQLKAANVSEKVIEAMLGASKAESPPTSEAPPQALGKQSPEQTPQRSSSSGSVISGSEQTQSFSLQDPGQLVGKQVNVGRLPLCQPGTYTADLSHAGKQATVLAAKHNSMVPTLPERAMTNLTPEMRALVQDQQKAATLLLQFEDGTKLDSCAPLGPRTLANYLELPSGESLNLMPDPIPTASLAPPVVSAHQECPVLVSKVSSSEGGFAHSLADSLTTSEFERQLDETIHEGREKHYLDMRMRNNSSKAIRAVESVALYSNMMGDESVRDSLITQNPKPIKPGQEFKSYFMDRSLQSASGKGEVTLYVQRVRFEDGTFWQDNGSHSCALTSRISR